MWQFFPASGLVDAIRACKLKKRVTPVLAPETELAESPEVKNVGGRHETRTRDLLVANEALFQLS